MYAERFQTFSGLISRAEKALQRAKAENVRGYGLRSVHVSCLLALYEHEEGLTGTELAAVCGVDRAQISRVAAELTGMGLICEAAPGPRRRYRGALTLTEEGRELTAQIAPLVERSRKLERYYSERRAADRVSLSVASQRYPFCAKAFVEFLHLLDEPHIQVSFKEMEMAAVIDEVTARRSAFGIIFVSDMTEHFIGRILREKNLTFQPLVDIRPRVFLRKGHPLSGERAVRLEQLYAYPYAVFTQSDSNYHFAEEAVVGTGAEFDRVVSVSDRATAYNVMAHTDCVSTGSGVLPDGYGDDRLMTLPLIGDVPDMRLGVIRPRDVPLTDYGQQFVDILQHTLSELTGE